MFKKFFSSWSPAILWAGLIFYLSSLSVLPPTGNWFFDFIVPNLAHLTEYGILFALIWRARRNVFLSFVLTIIYALSDEFHQAFVPTRTASLIDILVDIFGMIIAWLVIWKLLPKAPEKLKNWAKNWQII
ncbi:VanZ family protein [Candidatus Gottesmanbacteria bacterium]|nr:VanZ family protein [Candidatus Gottesmanbacteria bacterium]